MLPQFPALRGFPSALFVFPKLPSAVSDPTMSTQINPAKGKEWFPYLKMLYACNRGLGCRINTLSIKSIPICKLSDQNG